MIQECQKQEKRVEEKEKTLLTRIFISPTLIWRFKFLARKKVLRRTLSERVKMTLTLFFFSYLLPP